MNPKITEKRYGQWSGNTRGNRYIPGRCAHEVWGNWYSHQCSRKDGHGPDGLFCKQHAKLYEKE